MLQGHQVLVRKRGLEPLTTSFSPSVNNDPESANSGCECAYCGQMKGFPLSDKAAIRPQTDKSRSQINKVATTNITQGLHGGRSRVDIASSAFPDDLSVIIEAWPRLSLAAKECIKPVVKAEISAVG